MDRTLLDDVRRRSGLILPDELGRLSAGERRGIVAVQPRVFVAQTQPVDTATLVAAVDLSVSGHAFAGLTALWIYGVVAPHPGVDVAIADSRQLVLLPPAQVRRLAPSLWRGLRHVNDRPVVALETAAVQSAETLAPDDLLAAVEHVLRHRLTTHDRLLRACRRGVKGSAALRHTLDVVVDGDLEHLKREMRRALEAAGVVGLQSEVPVRSSTGATAYLDLVHRATGNAFELDGWLTHADRARFVADRQRDRWVRREHGITTTRVAADEARRSMPDVVEELLPLVVPAAQLRRRPPAA
jgi:hypothetical protein